MKKLLTFLVTTSAIAVFGQTEKKQEPTDFIPKGYVVFEEISGDLNKDGIEDCVFIIKGTDSNQIITDDYRGQLDRNRRGIIILFKGSDHYELALKNYDCFSSEHEDGGVYYAPELSVTIDNGNLYIHYGHGRYGYWKYSFRFQNSDFELIGYDEGYRSNFDSDWVTFDEESLNFLSKKKLIKEVIKVSSDGKETYKKTWENLSVNKLIKLSEVKNFDELEVMDEVTLSSSNEKERIEKKLWENNGEWNIVQEDVIKISSNGEKYNSTTYNKGAMIFTKDGNGFLTELSESNPDIIDTLEFTYTITQDKLIISHEYDSQMYEMEWNKNKMILTWHTSWKDFVNNEYVDVKYTTVTKLEKK